MTDLPELVPIPYEPDGLHKDMDLTGWWVRVADIEAPIFVKDWVLDDNIGTGRYEVVNCKGILVFRWVNLYAHETGIDISPQWSCYKVTHLLGIDPPKKLHPQTVADMTQRRVYLCNNGVVKNLWLYSEFESCERSIIQPYDPNTMQTEYTPRPVWEGE